MESSQLEQLKSMSLAARTSHYLKKLIAKEITRQQYDDILEVVLRLPYTTVVLQGSEIRGDIGEQQWYVSERQSEVCVPVEGATREDASTASVELSSSVLVRKPTDAEAHGHSGKKDDKSQKQKLLTFLSDHEWKTTPQIQVAVYGANHLGVARIAPRILDLKNDGYDIESRKITQAIWSYRLVEKGMRWISDNIASA